jgi:maleylpyruvate isomerase
MTTTTSPQGDIAAVEAATTELMATARRLADADIEAPSLCDGWTRGHVLAHLSRNADAIGRLVRWAVTGERHEMYPGGPGARDAEIAAGAHRGAEEQLRDLTSSAQELADRLPSLAHGIVVPEVEGRGGVTMVAADLPFMRLREVVFHHVDLDAGYSFDDVDGELLARFIADALRRLGGDAETSGFTVRTAEGDEWTFGDGGVSVAGTRAGVLLWLARRVPDRIDVDGPPPELPRGA